MSTSTRIALADYDRTIAEGRFAPAPKRQRIELIERELRPMSPIGPVHERLVDILNEWSLTTLPRGVAWVRIQNSIGTPDSRSPMCAGCGAAIIRKAGPAPPTFSS